MGIASTGATQHFHTVATFLWLIDMFLLTNTSYPFQYLCRVPHVLYSTLRRPSFDEMRGVGHQADDVHTVQYSQYLPRTYLGTRGIHCRSLVQLLHRSGRSPGLGFAASRQPRLVTMRPWAVQRDRSIMPGSGVGNAE